MLHQALERLPAPALTDQELLEGFYRRQRRRRAVIAVVLGAAVLGAVIAWFQLS